MIRAFVTGTLLIVIAAGLSLVVSRSDETDLTPGEFDGVSSRRLSTLQTSPLASSQRAARSRSFGAPRELSGVDEYRAALEKRVDLLEGRLEEEAAERRRLEEQLANLTSRLDASDRGPTQPTTVHAGPVPQQSAPADAAAPPAEQSVAAAGPPIDFSLSPMERALAAAGLDADTAADIKYRHDDLTMNEMYLRDQATREQWLDTPRFAEEMAKINAQRTTVRDEIGDEAYDRYLFALGQTNRVRVDDVLSQSPAADVGLQSGDLIVRYGETRVFAPRDLVDQTHGGSLGDMVRLEVVRNGERFEVEVPRGPLGLRVNAAQDVPDAS